jgi:very-short-patch-repair endonuclease
MGRLSQFDAAALARLLVLQSGVVSRRQALTCAMTEPAIRHRIRPDGPWQTILPGVYLTASGAPTPKQRVTAAWLYADKAIAVTGPTALAWYRLPSVRSQDVDVLVPLECRRRDAQFARMHRTGVVPECAKDGIVRYAAPARAVADTARQLLDFEDVRAVVAGSVQRRKVTIAELAEALNLGPIQGSSRLRAVLAEVADGVRSAAEGDLHGLVKRARLPEPMYNAQLFVGETLLAIPDAWWPQAGLAVEVDSREWHLSPADWERTLARGARMTEHGILILRFTPRQIRLTGDLVASQIRAVLGSPTARPLPKIVARRAA